MWWFICWLYRLDKKEKSKKKFKITNDKCYQYATAVALNHEEFGSNPERVSNIKPFINKYNWDRIKYSSETKKIGKDLKKIMQQLLLKYRILKKWKYVVHKFQIFTTVVLNVLDIKEIEIYPAYISNIYSSCEKQIIL